MNAKRILSCILLLALLAGLFPVFPEVVHAAQEELHTVVHRQVIAYADSIAQKNAETTAATALLTNAAFLGKDLTMDEDNAMTAMIYSAYMFREGLTHSLVSMVGLMRQMGTEALICDGMMEWRSNSAMFYLSAYRDGEPSRETRLQLAAGVAPIYGDQKYLLSKYNACDKMLVSTVGGMDLLYRISVVEIRDDTVIYDIDLHCSDQFHYNADYSESEYNRDYEQLLALFGGLTLREFGWESHSGFRLEVPNECSHASGDYRWEYDGKGELVSVTGEGLVLNTLTRTQGTTENGVFSQTIYNAGVPIELRHDRPWVLEMRCTGTGFLVLEGMRSGGIYLQKAANTLFFGESVFLSEEDETKTLTHYGVWFTGKTGISSADTHTYTLTNRILEDGSNMVYLRIDDMDLGPMNQYYHSDSSQHMTKDWVAGKDFNFARIGTDSYPISNMSVEYIQVWENGIGNPPYSHFEEKAVAPTCVEAGHVLRRCTKCGYSYKTDYTDKLEHDYAEKVIAPTCTAEGYTNYRCVDCGDSYQADIVEKLPHNVEEYVPNNNATCSHDGTKTGKCTVCGYLDIVPDVGTQLPHAWADATCTKPQTCKSCGATEGSALGHALWYANGKEPTCTEVGWAAYEKCSRCKYSTFQQIPALGHDFVNNRCANCGLWDGPVQLGDVNGDGEIDTTDAYFIVMYYNEMLDLTEEQLLAADVNGDGQIDTTDAYYIVLFYNEMIDTFPMAE